MNLPRSWFALVVGLVALAIYTTTAAPGIAELFDDTLEFQVVGPTFGIAHPTGYPLYVLLSGLWSRVLFPFGEWAWRMNLFSAVMGAAAVAVTARLGERVAPLPAPWRKLAGLGAAVVFGLGPVWWSQTTEAEVYALHLFFVALILNLTLWILDHDSTGDDHLPQQGRIVPETVRRVTLLALVMGLALAHHRTIVLLFPGVALVLLWQRPRLLRPARRWAVWLAALLAPLLLYLWIPWRAAMGVQDLHGSYENTWRGFWDHVLARRYVAFFSENPLMIERTPSEWGELFVAQMGLLALLLALGGLVLYPLQSRRINAGWTLVVLTLGANLIFGFNYRVGDVEVFLLPAFLSLALLATMGLRAIATLILGEPTPQATQGVKRTRVWLCGGVLALALGGLLLGVGGRDAFASRAQEWSAHDYAYLVATVDFPPHSRVIGLEGEITGLRYMQVANGLARNAQGIVANLPEPRHTAIAAGLVSGAPVFITRELAGIEQRYHFSGAGPLIRVWSAPPELPPLAQEIGYALEGAPLRLEAAAWRVRDLPGGPRLELTLDWQLTAPIADIYKLSLRVLDPVTEEPHVDRRGRSIMADVFPLRQVALTSDWPLMTPMRDVHYLALPQNGRESMQLQMIIYNAASVEEAGRWEVSLP